MKIGHEYGLPIVKAFEGCLKPIKGKPGYFSTYYCPANVLTIGWGHTNLGNIPPRIDDSTILSQAQCDQALVNDMDRFERRVDKIMKGVELKQFEFDALVSFDFNTGGLDRSSIPAKIKSGRRDEVAGTLDRWNKANGQVLNGLVRRRKSEGLLFDGHGDAALVVAGASRGIPMAQRVDRPKPPAAEVVKRAGPELATAGAGGLTTGAGTQAPKANEIGAGPTLMVLGLIVVAIGVVLLIRKYRKIDADWA